MSSATVSFEKEVCKTMPLFAITDTNEDEEEHQDQDENED
jgi:hypothetical protein